MSHRSEQRQVLAYLRRKGTGGDAATIRSKLTATFADLDRHLLAVGEETARRRPGPGRWSVQEIADHLVASHRPAAEELTAIVAGRRPPGEPIPAGLVSAEPLAADWPAVRAAVATAHGEVLAAIAEAGDDLAGTATAPVVMVVRVATDGGGSEPVEWLEELDWKAYALALRAHVLEHVRQIERTLDVVAS